VQAEQPEGIEMKNDDNMHLLIGSNDAYRWYALLDADGVLRDCASEPALRAFIPDLLAGQWAECDLGDWQGSWDDNDQGAMFRDWVNEEGRVACGEEAALDIYGGTIDARVNSDADRVAYLAGLGR
jgi:hypothetical protein